LKKLPKAISLGEKTKEDGK
jgi:hypothetical protein